MGDVIYLDGRDGEIDKILLNISMRLGKKQHIASLVGDYVCSRNFEERTKRCTETRKRIIHRSKYSRLILLPDN